jgi:hypothetical protein
VRLTLFTKIRLLLLEFKQQQHLLYSQKGESSRRSNAKAVQHARKQHKRPTYSSNHAAAARPCIHRV